MAQKRIKMGLNVYAGTCIHENQFLSFFEPSVFAIFGFGEKNSSESNEKWIKNRY